MQKSISNVDRLVGNRKLLLPRLFLMAGKSRFIEIGESQMVYQPAKARRGNHVYYFIQFDYWLPLPSMIKDCCKAIKPVWWNQTAFDQNIGLLQVSKNYKQ